jgi:UDP-N-acetyl-D-galactosamine dehydrogenase
MNACPLKPANKPLHLSYMNLTSKNIAIIGLGYVGLPLAVEFGKQRPVLGFDIASARIAELQAGRDHTWNAAAKTWQQPLSCGYSCQPDDLRACHVFIVTVPTPVDKANRPDMTPLIKASETVAHALKVGDIVIYESTVYPGVTEEVCVPVLERVSPALQPGLSFAAIAPSASTLATKSTHSPHPQDHQWQHP